MSIRISRQYESYDWIEVKVDNIDTTYPAYYIEFYIDGRYDGKVQVPKYASSVRYEYNYLQPNTRYTLKAELYDYVDDDFLDYAFISLWTDPLPLEIPRTPTLKKGTQTTNSAVLEMSNYGTAEHFIVEGRRDDTVYWSNYSNWAYNPYTVTGLLNGRSYDFRVAGANDAGTSGWSNIVTFDIGSPRPSNWVWEYTISQGGNFYNQVDKNVYLMRAVHWNTFTTNVNLFRAYKLGSGYNYAFTQATTATSETAMRVCINQAIDKVNDMLSTGRIASVTTGDTVKAATFQQLRDRLNSL